jgi:hypothetical protein
MDPRMDDRQRRRAALWGLAVVAMAAAAITAVPSLTASALTHECLEYDQDGFCIRWRVHSGNTTSLPPDDDPPPSTGGGGPEEPDPCPWERHSDQSKLHDYFPDAPPEAILLTRQCGPYWNDDCGIGGGGCSVQPQAELTWALPDEVGDLTIAPPSPEQVAQDLLADVPIEDPAIVVSPALDVAAVLDVPTFIQVTNWAGTQSQQDCATIAAVCVGVEATPTLSFDPSESDPATGWTAPVVNCEAPGSQFDPGSGLAGTAYDPAGPEPREQAGVDGACAHTYRLRTGVGQRPNQWSGSVRITWTARWWVTNPDQSGEFDPITMATDLPREVEEIQAPVVDGSLGGS